MTGNILYRSKEFVIDAYGVEKFNSILVEMSEPAKTLFGQAIIGSKDYDTKVFMEFLRASEKILGRSELKNMSTYCFEKQITGLYGFLLKFISIEKVINSAQMMWDKNYREGKIKIENKDYTQYLITVTEFEYSDPMLYAAMYYLQSLIEQITKKKTIATYKRLGPTTTQFTYTILLDAKAKT